MGPCQQPSWKRRDLCWEGHPCWGSPDEWTLQSWAHRMYMKSGPSGPRVVRETEGISVTGKHSLCLWDLKWWQGPTVWTQMDYWPHFLLIVFLWRTVGLTSVLMRNYEQRRDKGQEELKSQCRCNWAGPSARAWAEGAGSEQQGVVGSHVFT